MEQLEFGLDDWRLGRSAPKSATWVLIKLRNGTIWAAHFAQDLSGEDQPPFSGWFRFAGKRDYALLTESDPAYWRPFSVADFIRAGGDAACSRCGHRYYDHPFYKEVWTDVEWGDKRQYYLHIACDGRLLKL